MDKTNDWSLKDITIMALYVGLTVIGTTIRVPLPALMGNPFFHFGMPILCLAVLTLGFFKGSLAGGVGFVIFDVLNGLIVDAPIMLVESFVVGGALYLSCHLFKSYQEKLWFIPLVMSITAVVKVTIVFIENLLIQLIMGNSLEVSAVASVSTLYITALNAVVAVIIVSILYKPVSHLYQRVSR